MSFITAFTLCQVSQDASLEALHLQGLGDLFPGFPTSRLLIPVNINGTHIRLRFQNASSRHCGIVRHCTIAKCSEKGVLLSETLQDITIDREAAFSLSPGQEAVSDVLPFSVSIGDWLAVSVYCSELPPSSNSISPLQMQSPLGDFCLKTFENRDSVSAIREQGVEIFPTMPLFCALEIDTDCSPAIVTCLGDSITQQGYWYAPLMKWLYQCYPGKVCLLNYGIGGNRLLKDSEPAFMGGFGQALLSRVQKDDFKRLRATHAIVAIGVNDLIHGGRMDPEPSPSPEQFAQGCCQLAEMLHRAGMKTMAYTIYPSTLEFPLLEGEDPVRSKHLEPLFHAYNRAIRSAGFEKIVELQPILGFADRLGYQDGFVQPDGLHLNATGGQTLADAIELVWFEKSELS